MRSLRPFLGWFLVPAVLVAWAPGAFRDGLLFNRDAILHGQVWRLWTGHWVHFSAAHLVWDLSAMALVGPGLAQRRPGWLGRYLLVAAPLISLGLLVCNPTMVVYGGLSGLGTGLVVLLGLDLVGGKTRGDVGVGWGLLILVAAKLVFDLTQARPLLMAFDSTEIWSASWAHVVGVAVAGGFYQFRRGRESRAA